MHHRSEEPTKNAPDHADKLRRGRRNLIGGRRGDGRFVESQSQAFVHFQQHGRVIDLYDAAVQPADGYYLRAFLQAFAESLGFGGFLLLRPDHEKIHDQPNQAKK